jgi:hypothetical protein
VSTRHICSSHQGFCGQSGDEKIENKLKSFTWKFKRDVLMCMQKFNENIKALVSI